MSVSSMVNRVFGIGNSSAPVVVGSSDTRSSGKATGKNSKRDFCKLLDPAFQHTESELKKLWKMLEKEMSLVPSGSIVLGGDIDSLMNSDEEAAQKQIVSVGSLYIDRTAVSNTDFLEFVRADGYKQVDLWAAESHSMLTQFVDTTDLPGPAFWANSKPPRDKLNHPVVGICWYEADAYARWLGKQLPSNAQWQRASSWHHSDSESSRNNKYPWGATFDKDKANSWASGIEQTVPVDQYYAGATPNGVFQLVGNTWEWTNSLFASDVSPDSLEGQLVEVRGGAFDTYLDSQLDCQFRSAQNKLARINNLGFRCVVESSKLQQPEQ